MKCPNCSVNLVMSDRNGVEIDYCPECRGVWLDRGELDKIIDRSVNGGAPVSNIQRDPNYGHNDRDREMYKKKRKDSFLGDLFDF